MSEQMKFWKRTVFWENIKRTIALVSGPGIYAEHKMDAHEWVMIGTLILAFIGGALAIWCTDHNKNGIVDLFE